jgi:ERCC4-type nuclease
MTNELNVDIRESQRTIDALRAEAGEEWDVNVAMFEVADVFYTNRFGIEHKRPNDFANSITDNRIFQQAAELNENFAQPFILVSGTLDDAMHARRGLSPESVKGVVASLCTRRGVPVLFAENEFASLVLRLAAKTVKTGPIEYNPVRKTGSTQDKRYALLTQLPQVGETIAERILDEYPNPLIALNNIGEWPETIHGIGPTSKDEIIDVLE